MAINNINALVDLEGLEKLNNSDYVSKYYNAGLANQGQRWTNEVLLEYKHFNIANLIAYRYYNVNDDIDPYITAFEYSQYINKKAYLVITQKNTNTFFSLENLYFSVCDPRNGENNILDLKTIDGENFDNISNDNINNILFSKKLWIIKKLYEKVIADIAYDSKNKDDYAQSFNDDYEHDDIYSDDSKVYKKYNSLQLWIPLDYSFEYICDGVNKSVIYGDHKNIAVYIEPASVLNSDNPVWNDPNKSGIIYIKTERKYVKTCIYNFSFTKVSEIPTILRSNILPFIDDDNYWWINNTPTPIIAKAEKPTNLNIILAYLHKTGNSNELRILSGLSDDFNTIINIDYLSSRKVWIKRHNGKSFSIICKVPIISEISKSITDDDTKVNIIKILENSTIILMTKLTKLLDNESDEIKKEYKDGLITTIWTHVDEPILDHETNEYNDYDYITIEEDEDGHSLALDFGEITNFSNLINFKVNSLEQVAPDNYLNRHIIFDQILKNNKQEVTNTFAYAVMQNIKGNEYNNKYVNNFNFSLRYVNNVVGTVGNIIEKVSNTTDNKYFKVPTTESSNLVTNSIYQKIVNNRTIYYPEYIPNYNVPVFDLSEVLIKDSNVMNRQNIISFTDAGLEYYAYIGTSPNDYDKSILHIGTDNTDINLGEYSLIDNINKANFKTHNSISIDFSYSYLNSYAFVQNDLNVGENIYFNKFNFEKKNVGDYDVYSTQIIPKFKYILNSNGTIYHEISISNMAQNLNNIIRNIESTNSEFNKDPNYLYVNVILSNKIKNIDYYYKYSDLLYIDNLIKYLGITDIINEVVSNTNKIIYNSNGTAKFMISSNNLLVDSINITASSDTKISITVQNIQDIYVGNQLNVVLIKNKGYNKLIIDEYQSHKIKSIWKLPEHI